MLSANPKEWTYEEYLALPEGGSLHYEVIDGKLYMTPAPNIRHQEVSGNLFEIIRHFLRSNPVGKLFAAPCDVILSRDPLQVVEPDLVFVSKERSESVRKKNIQGIPDLVVEILSEGTEKRDRREKFTLYERSGVPEYWIVDPETETLQVFQLSGKKFQAPRDLRKEDTLSSPLLPGLAIPLSEVFSS